MTDADGLIDVIVEFAGPLSQSENLRRLLSARATCLTYFRVGVVGSYCAVDGTRAVLVCRAPDAESVRLVCRRADIVFDRIWACRDPSAARPDVS